MTKHTHTKSASFHKEFAIKEKQLAGEIVWKCGLYILSSTTKERTAEVVRSSIAAEALNQNDKILPASSQ